MRGRVRTVVMSVQLLFGGGCVEIVFFTDDASRFSTTIFQRAFFLETNISTCF